MTDLLVTILLCWKTTGDYKSLLENTGDNWRFCSNIPGIRSWCYSPNLLYYESLRSTKHAHIHTAQANTPKHPQTTPLTNTHHSPTPHLAGPHWHSVWSAPLPPPHCQAQRALWGGGYSIGSPLIHICSFLDQPLHSLCSGTLEQPSAHLTSLSERNIENMSSCIV